MIISGEAIPSGVPGEFLGATKLFPVRYQAMPQTEIAFEMGPSFAEAN